MPIGTNISNQNGSSIQDARLRHMPFIEHRQHDVLRAAAAAARAIKVELGNGQLEVGRCRTFNTSHGMVDETLPHCSLGHILFRTCVTLALDPEAAWAVRDNVIAYHVHTPMQSVIAANDQGRTWYTLGDPRGTRSPEDPLMRALDRFALCCDGVAETMEGGDKP